MFTECLDTVRAQKRLLAMGFPQNTKFSGQYKCQAHSSVLAPLRQFCNLGLYCTLMSMEELGVPTTTSLIRQNRELLTQTAVRCFHYQTIFQINSVPWKHCKAKRNGSNENSTLNCFVLKEKENSVENTTTRPTAFSHSYGKPSLRILPSPSFLFHFHSK